MSKFKDIIDQRQLVGHLQNALRTGRINHAYLMTGEQGMGKKFIADIFARTLVCEHPAEEGAFLEPCNACHACVRAQNHEHPDIIYVSHEKPNSVGVDDIRTQVRDTMMVKPFEAAHKVYIIADGDLMTPAAQNALLKTLEEPPAYAVILILATGTGSFLQTILSRCIQLEMKPAPDEAIRQFLMQERRVVDYQADLCVAFARGNVGKAIRLSEDSSFEVMKDAAFRLLSNMPRMTIADMNTAVSDLLIGVQEGEKISEAEKKARKQRSMKDFLDLILYILRDILVYKADAGQDHLIFRDQISYIRNAADHISYASLRQIQEQLQQTQRQLDANVNADLAMEMLLMNMKENIQTS